MKRQLSRYIPQGYTPTTCPIPDGLNVAVYEGQSTGSGKYLAIGYIGKQSKSTFHYAFGTEEKRRAHVEGFIAGQMKVAGIKAGWKAERNQPNMLKVGDILVWTWGYDQTNKDFFEVTAVHGVMIEMRGIGQEETKSTGWMTGDVMPTVGAFLTDAPVQTKRVIYGKQVSMEFGCCDLWDGQPEHYTAYA